MPTEQTIALLAEDLGRCEACDEGGAAEVDARKALAYDRLD
jgi:hypothetical protein